MICNVFFAQYILCLIVIWKVDDDSSDKPRDYCWFRCAQPTQFNLQPEENTFRFGAFMRTNSVTRQMLSSLTNTLTKILFVSCETNEATHNAN